MLKGERLPLFCLRLPSHIPSVLEMFILRPEHSPNLLRRLNKWSAEESLSMKAVMSSAYRLSFISVSLSFRPHVIIPPDGLGQRFDS